ncbi:MAG: HEAT repeat domain-containing protein [Planctomycetota bacterium]|nr:HEAT repeat domain-containing protein [Planctomycetota bacterium]
MSSRYYVRLDLNVEATTRNIDSLVQYQHQILMQVYECPSKDFSRELLSSQRSTLFRALLSWRIGHEEHFSQRQTLIRLTSDSSASVRFQAAIALAKMGSNQGEHVFKSFWPDVNFITKKIILQYLPSLAHQ